MIYLKNVGHIDTVQNLNIIEVIGSGENELNFEIPVMHEYYPSIFEEMGIVYDGQHYVIKSIDEQEDRAIISCRLDLDDLQKNAVISYREENQHLYTLLNFALTGTGWSYEGADRVSARKATELEAGNVLDLLRIAQEVYRCVFYYDTKSKLLTVFPLSAYQYKGVYFTDELNISQLFLRGDSFDFCTRLIPIGADGLRIDSVNDGYSYIENIEYCSKTITRVWKDERYTDAQELKDEAIEKLKVLSKPNRTYSLDVIDLASINSQYSHLSFKVGDKVMLIDRKRNVKVEHQVARLVTYPDNPQRNKAELAATAKGFESVVQNLTGLIDGTNVVVSIQGKRISKLTLDFEAFTLELSNFYTKGETETYIGSQIKAESDRIDLIVDEQINRVDTLSGEVTSVSTNMTELSLTVGGFDVRITSAEDSVSALSQTASKIDWLVKSGSSAANFTLTDRTISLVSSAINLTGFVTFSALSAAGQTTINGGNITTGTLDASKVTVTNLQINNIKYGTYSVITCTGNQNNPVIAIGKDQLSGSANPTSLSIYGTTINVGDETSTLYKTNIKGGYVTIMGGSYVNIGYSSTYFVQFNSRRELRPSVNSTTYPFYLGTASYPWSYAYVGNLYAVTSVRIGTATSSKLGFFGTAPVARKTVAAVATSATLAQTITGHNNLLNALKGYGFLL